MNLRQTRKLDHVRLAGAQPAHLATGGGLPAPGWADVHLVHRSLPELDLDSLELSTSIAGVRLAQPVLINAMTGGAPGVGEINRDLARVAADLNLAMAVGSQTAGIRNPEVAGTYRVVRQENPRGVIIANVSAGAAVADALAAVEMVEANLLQLHLNAPQELVMREGDRDFRGQLDRIAEIVQAAPVPVIVKECGFGLSRETALQLHAVGVRAVDVSGRGGTNFAWIESRRSDQKLDPGLEQWGLPTAVAVAEVAALDLPELDVVASGGITWGSEAAKALALGACGVGVAGAVLRRYQKEGIDGARRYLERVLADLRRVMLLSGAATIRQQQCVPVVLTGSAGEWCRLRGVNLEAFARR